MSDHGFHPLVLADRRPTGNAGVILTLSVPDELKVTFTGKSGQHLVIRQLIDRIDVRRTYSLISPAGWFPLEIAVRRHGGGAMSDFLSEQLKVGAAVAAMAPRGGFVSRSSGSACANYLALAAGSGISPVLAILRDKLEHETECRCLLVCANRDSLRAMCLDDVMALKDRYLDRLSLMFLMSREPQDLAQFNGRIDARWLQECLDRHLDLTRVDECFVCVPGLLDGALRGALEALGVEDSVIHLESFTATGAKAVARRSEPEMGAVRVTVVMGGRRRDFLCVDPNESVLDAAMGAGVELPYSCCGGVCSTCRARLVEGEVAMAQNYALEDWELEAGFVLVCQSRPITSSIVLDYDSV